MKLYVFHSIEDPATAPKITPDEMKAHEMMAEFVGETQSDFRVNRNWEDLDKYFEAFCEYCEQTNSECFNFWIVEI